MIYITGDTHGDYDISKINTTNWALQKQLTRDDYLIICGAFGGVWYNNRKDNYLLNWHEKKPYTSLFVDGNHENFDALEQYPVTTWKGGSVHMIRPHVIHLMRGQIYTIDGSTFFTFGGGTSADKSSRKEGISWWPQEVPTPSEMDVAIKNLARHHNQVDYIITHAAPQSVLWQQIPCHRADLRIDCPCEDFFENLMKTVTYQQWFCGHYHLDTYLAEARLKVLYNNIYALDSITKE